VNWQQDPFGNFAARLVFPEPVEEFCVAVDLTADMTVINPFDFFLEPDAEEYPFTYSPALAKDLKPFLETETPGPHLAKRLAAIDLTPRRTIDFLVGVNVELSQEIKYLIRMEPGVQTCEQTLGNGSGSCRDSAWLLVQMLRHVGIAARFTSGYLVQLASDQKSLDGPSGPEEDFTDLHAWCEAYLPGAGWIGLDPTSGLLASEGHMPLACTPSPHSAAPISGALAKCEVEFDFAMTVRRDHEDPRVTLPYTDQQWAAIDQLGTLVDQRLAEGDVRLTMGGEPTFVSIDDMESDEWNTAAMGPNKRRLSEELMAKLKDRFANGPLLHYGQGKWYPGESLPRWALTCYWRKDGQPLWKDQSLFAEYGRDYGHTVADAQRFLETLAKRLGVQPQNSTPAYEDTLYYLWKERRLPENLDLSDPALQKEEERRRLTKVLEHGPTTAVGTVLPLQKNPAGAKEWRSNPWPMRSDRLFLSPGDSPVGYRLPLESLPWAQPKKIRRNAEQPVDPFAPREMLPEYEALQARRAEVQQQSLPATAEAVSHGGSPTGAGGGWNPQTLGVNAHLASDSGDSNGHSSNGDGPQNGVHLAASDPAELIRTAICAEPRHGSLHIFMPPVECLEDYLELVSAIESTAAELQLPVVIEGYQPPHDPRITNVKVTPDPGVIEVNVQPASDWEELKTITTGVYDDARQTRLGTEKFDLDGAHSGTGGGNHVVLGGSTPADSPFLRRPHVLASLIAYWNNHPSLSYMFSGKFIGPTSQAPRVDEGRRDAIYELQIALDLIHQQSNPTPWFVDRALRNLLVDLTGNTHRAEFCIDKLYSPDSSTGRLGLVEFRALEMPPHARMSLTQQLLLRALTMRFWDRPYKRPLMNWDTSLHDRFLLPHFVWSDFNEVISGLRGDGYAFESDWFDAHFEFRFPFVGEVTYNNMHMELRSGIEPWYVLGEEPGAAATARYVDSSVERMQIKLSNFTEPRYVVMCNGRRVPLHPTGVAGEFVAGLRYRAWQPPSCLHPTIPVDEPLLFDIVDTWNGRSIGGCRYHVGHPGGLNPSSFPVNALEAESRRGGRFFKMGHTAGSVGVPPMEANGDFPLTLDLRRNKPAV